MQTVTLPSGKRAHLRAVSEVTERQRRPLVKIRTKLAQNQAFAQAVIKAENSKKLTKAEEAEISESLGDVLELVEEMGDRIVIAAVESWDYGFEVSYDNLLDITAQDLDKLREVAAPYMQELMPDFSPSKDQDSPTGV
jgi:hypothetical protein